MKDDTVQLISVAANTTGSERIGVLTLTGYCRVGTSTFRKGLMYVSAQESKSLSSTSVSARACMARLK